MKIKLVLADSDSVYLEHFAACVQMNYFDQIELAVFTNQEALETYLKKEECNALLYSPGFEQKGYQGLRFLLTSEKEMTEKDGVPAICKYQKMERIYKTVLSALSETRESYKLNALKEKDGTKVITFLSASGGAGKTLCAMTAARLQALQNKRVLYLSTEILPTLEEYISDSGDVTLSQIFFAIKRSKGNVPMKIESALHVDEQGVYYILPADNPLEMLEITAENWKELLIQLIGMKKFDVIVVDMEQALLPAMQEILVLSDVLLTVTSGQTADIRRCQALFRAFRIREKQQKESWMEKLFYVWNHRTEAGGPQELGGVQILGRVMDVPGVTGGKGLVDYMVENNLTEGLAQLH